jgi:hypothetical protein
VRSIPVCWVYPERNIEGRLEGGDKVVKKVIIGSGVNVGDVFESDGGKAVRLMCYWLWQRRPGLLLGKLVNG